MAKGKNQVPGFKVIYEDPHFDTYAVTAIKTNGEALNMQERKDFMARLR